MVSLDFHRLFKILFAVHLKHFDFGPSADLKTMSNAVLHAVPRQCMFDLYKCTQQSLCNTHIHTNRYIIIYLNCYQRQGKYKDRDEKHIIATNIVVPVSIFIQLLLISFYQNQSLFNLNLVLIIVDFTSPLPPFVYKPCCVF